MQRHLCTLSRMPGLSTVSTFYSQDIRIQQAELCPWFEQTTEVNILSWLLVAYLLGYSLLTLTERSLNNFLCLISMLVFQDLLSLYFGFFLGNFAVHSDLHAPHFVSSDLPFHISEKREKHSFGSLIWVRPVELVFLSAVWPSHHLVIIVSFFPTRTFFWEACPNKSFVSPSLYKVLQELVAHDDHYYYYLHYYHYWYWCFFTALTKTLLGAREI